MTLDVGKLLSAVAPVVVFTAAANSVDWKKATGDALGFADSNNSGDVVSLSNTLGSQDSDKSQPVTADDVKNRAGFVSDEDTVSALSIFDAATDKDARSQALTDENV